MPLKNLNSRNAELISTYYRNGKYTGQKNEKSFHKGRIFIILSLFLLLILSTAGYIFIRAHNSSEATTLFTAKRYANINYFDYNKIKENKTPITLNVEDAGAAVNFSEDVDLRNATISFSAKGKSGTERLAVILKDKYNFSNANREDIILTPSLGKDKWQPFNIKLSGIYLPLNKTMISQLRFDASANLTGNDEAGEVYIKDISIDTFDDAQYHPEQSQKGDF